MKRKLFMAILLCVVFALNAIPVMAQQSGNEQQSSPYKLATTLEDTRAALRLRNSSIIVTNVEVPEILSGEINGIVITEQDLNEALAVLDEAYNLYGLEISNLVTPSVSFSDWTPTPEQQERINQAQNTALRPITRGTSIPTKYCPDKTYSWSWSGTLNYTYTNYLIPASTSNSGDNGSFLQTSATTPHYVICYGTNGSNLGTKFPTKFGSVYSTGITQPRAFYGKITNQTSGVASKNASYYIEQN